MRKVRPRDARGLGHGLIVTGRVGTRTMFPNSESHSLSTWCPSYGTQPKSLTIIFKLSCLDFPHSGDEYVCGLTSEEKCSTKFLYSKQWFGGKSFGRNRALEKLWEPQFSPALVLTLPALCLPAGAQAAASAVLKYLFELYAVFVSRGCLCNYTQCLTGEEEGRVEMSYSVKLFYFQETFLQANC